VYILTQDAEWEDEWGTRWGHAFGGVGATPRRHPLEDWNGLDDYLARRLPDPRAPGRMDAATEVLRMHGRDRYCCGTIHLALFERLHALRGMADVFADFYTHPAEVRRLLEAIAAYTLELIRMWGGLGADAVFLTDDWGSQTAMMISPAMWREFFKAHYTALFAEAHRLGMDVIFHSCGNVTAIVENLIEIGMDVLDPLQPGAMDVDLLARRFGGRVSFCGAVGLQQLLARGTPQQVRDAVRRLIDTLGRPFGGGFFVSPANVLTPDIPLANLEALFEGAHSQTS
jgi:uroporphyrinogen decarboxylase